MTQMKWFRLYSEMLHDRKLARIARTEQIPKTQLLGIWVSLLCIANDSPERGALMIGDDLPMTMEEIADELDIDPGDFYHIWAALLSVSMIEDKNDCYYIANWDKRQFKSDSSTARVKRYRKKKSKEGETLQKRFSNAPEQIQNRTDTEATAAPIDNEAGEIFTFYENNISQLNPFISDSINRAIDEHGHKTVMDAMIETANYGATSWKYTDTVLERWKREGRGKSNGKRPSKQDKAQTLIGIVKKFGRHRAKQAMVELEREGLLDAAKQIGWYDLCSMQEKDIPFAYYRVMQ